MWLTKTEIFQSMNNLKGARCYLAGAIEHDLAGMCSWRNQLKERLHDLGIVWMDPCDKPIAVGRETEETQAEMAKARADGYTAYVEKQMKLIQAIDLRMVDVSDFVVFDYSDSRVTTGTHEELARAASQNKPIVARIEGGKQKAPFWWFAELQPDLFCATWDEVEEYLRFADAIHPDFLHTWSSNRWLLFYT
jgi:nucleoside 2-deoxyribosyltransferase